MKMTTMIITTTNVITKDPEKIAIMNPRQNIMNPQLLMMVLDQEMDHAYPVILAMTIAMTKTIMKSVPMMEVTVAETMSKQTIAPYANVMKLIIPHPDFIHFPGIILKA